MKKFLTLLLLLCGASALSSAQTLTVCVDGEPLTNGSTYTKYYNVEAFDLMPGTPMEGKFFNYGLYPSITVTSTVDQYVSLTVTDVDKVGGMQCCYGGSCQSLDNSGYEVTKGQDIKAGTPTDLQIEVVRMSAASAPYSAKMNIVLRGNGETFSSTIILGYDPAAAGIASATASKGTTLHDLSGRRISQAPQRGVYIRNGRKIAVTK